MTNCRWSGLDQPKFDDPKLVADASLGVDSASPGTSSGWRHGEARNEASTFFYRIARVHSAAYQRSGIQVLRHDGSSVDVPWIKPGPLAFELVVELHLIGVMR